MCSSQLPSHCLGNVAIQLAEGRRVVGMGTITAIAIIAASALQNFAARREQFRDTKSSAMTTESTPEGSRPSATNRKDTPEGSRPSANFAWDAAESDISVFSSDLAPFESRSHQLWDNAPAMNKE
jgi:hypothetical protein